MTRMAGYQITHTREDIGQNNFRLIYVFTRSLPASAECRLEYLENIYRVM